MTLTRETAETALRLLTAYANSGVPDAVSLECAQVCGTLRNALAQPEPVAPSTQTCRLCGGANDLHWPGCIVMAGAE